jgi:hypothetical protein
MKPPFFMLALFVACSNPINGEPPLDADGDGHFADEDCDDTNPNLWNQCDVVAGASLCAAGGLVAGDRVHGITCTGPLDISSQPSSNEQFTWYPGPHHLILETSP